MKIARMLLIFALAGLVTMEAVSAQKDDKEADVVADDEEDVEEPTEEEVDDFFVDVPVDAPDATTGAPEEEEGDVAPDPFACGVVPADADCQECLEAGCVLTTGSCLSECAVADAACWDTASVGFANNTVDEICDIREAQMEDDEICGTLPILVLAQRCFHCCQGCTFGIFINILPIVLVLSLMLSNDR